MSSSIGRRAARALRFLGGRGAVLPGGGAARPPDDYGKAVDLVDRLLDLDQWTTETVAAESGATFASGPTGGLAVDAVIKDSPFDRLRLIPQSAKDKPGLLLLGMSTGAPLRLERFRQDGIISADAKPVDDPDSALALPAYVVRREADTLEYRFGSSAGYDRSVDRLDSVTIKRNFEK